MSVYVPLALDLKRDIGHTHIAYNPVRDRGEPSEKSTISGLQENLSFSRKSRFVGRHDQYVRLDARHCLLCSFCPVPPAPPGVPCHPLRN